jgi:putative ABC transport system ATP-binding protein
MMFPARNREPVVDIKAVNYAFGQEQVLFDNHLTMYPGEIIIMTGPSGAGKTTLLTLIGALRAPQEGSLSVFGRELKGLGPSEQEKIRRDIGFIFQTHNLLFSLTAYQNVKLATELHVYDKDDADCRTEGILTRLGLKDKMHFKPHALSEGQRQRVAICRALVNHPRMILADEPTASLDKDTRRQMIDVLYEYAKKEGCAILIVTHDHRILDVADRVITMTDGRIASDVGVNGFLKAESSDICGFPKR